MFYALIFDQNGNGIGQHAYVEKPSSYPANEIACTAAQAQNPMAYQVVNGQIVESLSAAQVAQVATLRTAYLTANASDISFTDSAGVADTYQADQDSIGYLNGFISAYRETGITPSGFYWRSATNNDRPFTYADLCGLGLAIANRGFANFGHLQGLLTQVMTATTVSEVQSIR